MIALLYFGCLMLQQSQKMLSDMRYNVSSDNSLIPLLSEEMTGELLNVNGIIQAMERKE